MQHYGREIIGKEMGLPVGHATVEKLWITVYKNFIEVRIKKKKKKKNVKQGVTLGSPPLSARRKSTASTTA